MPIKIASASEIAAKWAEVTPGRQKYYESATPAAASDWERETKAAAATFQAAVTAGDIGRRFSGGVTRAGAAKFARKVTAVGVARFGPGVREAQSDMSAGFEPFIATISSVSLPARGPRGDPGNLERVRVIAAALAAKRLTLIGAG